MGNTEEMTALPETVRFDEGAIIGFLPHRDPMLMVVEAEIQRDKDGKLIIAKGYPSDARDELPFRDEMSNLILTDKLSTATVKVMASDPGFAGHFPRQPILPAVQQLRLLRKLALMSEPDRRLYMSEINLKFSRLVLPGSELMLSVEQDGDSYQVKAMTEGEIACAGSIRFREMDNEGQIQSTEVLIESKAQLTALAELSLPENAGKTPLFRSIKMEVSRPIYFGEWPIIEVNSIKVRKDGNGGQAGQAKVNTHVIIEDKPEIIMSGTIGFATGN